MTITVRPVHLVGAGPGDPELLTLKAVRALRQASVILVDDLVPDAVLESALDGVASMPRVVHVGKRGGCASTPQAFIEALMVREALAGERVVRLKGGDPLVFGRASEELAALRAAGIPHVIVPGITSGLAAVGALGTGWTDRRCAQGVMLVTGHPKAGGTEPDWDAIAAAARGLTLVVYMGVSMAPRLVERLLPVLGPDWPAAAVQHASTPRQRCVLATLGSLVESIAREGLTSPAVLVIGRVLDAAATVTPLEISVRQQPATQPGAGCRRIVEVRFDGPAGYSAQRQVSDGM
jgi:uroporphyrin-III C-methyltransferase